MNHKLVSSPTRAFRYVLTFKFLPREAYQEDFGVKPKQIVKYMSKTFFSNMFKAITKAAKSKNTM